MPSRSLLGRLLAAVLLTLLAAPATAAQAAKPSREKSIWGPVRHEGKSEFPLYRELGVGIYQYHLQWNKVAPTRPADPRNPNDPAYRWPEELDFAVRESARYGIQVSLMVMRVPAWSNGGRERNVPPLNPRDYADFLEAASRRYGRVRHWMIFGEPVRTPNFNIHYGYPNQLKTNGPLTAQQKDDVRKYSELVDAAYGRLKRLNRRHLIIGGSTYTSGDWFGPEGWIKNMKLANGKPPRMDLYAHNPFTSRTPDLSKDQIAPGTADFSDLDLLEKWIDRYLHRAGRNRRLPVFISEFTAPTDVPSPEFNFYVTRKVQAKWLTAGLRIARRSKRIYTFGWIGLRDTTPNEKGEETRFGLIDATGRKKPSFYAYKRG